MKILDKESGKIFGIQILQPEAVRTESEKWFKENHPHFWVFQCVIGIIALFSFIGCRHVHEGMLLVITGATLLYILVLWKYYDQYDKQAPEGLKRI